MLVDPEFDQKTKIRYGWLEDGSKIRLSKKSGAIIHKPERQNLKVGWRFQNIKDGEKDTSPFDATEVTYFGENFEKIR